MTKEEFIARLRKDQEVNFDGSILSVASEVVAGALADSIAAVIPQGEALVDGVEAGSFGREWAGKLNWLIVLRYHVLELTSEIASEQVHGDMAKRLRIMHRFHRKDRLSAEIELKYSDARTHAVLAEAKFSLSVGDQMIEVKSGRDLKPHAACRFIGSLLSN